jgi:putative lipoic acid-binding regulatory protein
MTTVTSNPNALPEASLISYPCHFPIKVLGRNVDEFIPAITHIVKRFDPGFDDSTIKMRQSKEGNYMGVTVTITATSRDQLDEVYRSLSTHPLVKWVL